MDGLPRPNSLRCGLCFVKNEGRFQVSITLIGSADGQLGNTPVYQLNEPEHFSHALRLLGQLLADSLLISDQMIVASSPLNRPHGLLSLLRFGLSDRQGLSEGKQYHPKTLDIQIGFPFKFMSDRGHLNAAFHMPDRLLQVSDRADLGFDAP